MDLDFFISELLNDDCRAILRCAGNVGDGIDIAGRDGRDGIDDISLLDIVRRDIDDGAADGAQRPSLSQMSQIKIDTIVERPRPYEKK